MTRHVPNWLQQGSYPAAYDRDVLAAIWPAAAVSGCAVTAATGMTVNVALGRVAVPTPNNTGTVLCTSDAVEQVTLATAPGSGSNRYDLVICQPRGNDLDGGANNDFIFTTVTGTAAATPTVPATPPGTVALAQIYVPGGSASVTAGNIADRRPIPVGTVSRWYRNAAFTVGPVVAVPLDTASIDAYNQQTSAGFTCRQPGNYLVVAALAIASSAAGQSNVLNINKNGVNSLQSPQATPSTAGGNRLACAATDIFPLVVGDVVSIGTGNVPPAGLAGITGTAQTFLTVEYLGQ